MIRQIIKIDEEKCTGCGLCATACHEGAIDIVDGKAKLVREHYCDGLGDCLPACPVDAIHFEHREAPAYDEAAVSVRCAVCGDEQIGTVEVWGTYRDKLNLYGPLHKLTCVGIETVGSAGGGCGAAIAVGGGCI